MSRTVIPADEWYDNLAAILDRAGPDAAVAELTGRLCSTGAFTDLFYAKLMAARLSLGVSPIPTAPAVELPESVQADYEDAVRQAARAVGRLCLEAGDIPKAFGFYHLIGELDPVREALEAYRPDGDAGADDHFSELLAVAIDHGVHPRRGFELVLQRQGICAAISMLGGYDTVLSSADKESCIRSLVRALAEQLTERLRAEIESREGPIGPAVLDELIAGHDWLFDEDAYYIDVTHLHAVVQMSLQLEGGPELAVARSLAAFGERLPERFRHRGDPPFDDPYRDFGHYLAALAGDAVEVRLDHFRSKLPEPGDDARTYPAEVLVTLLSRLGRTAEALTLARRYLLHAHDRNLSCPGVYELCRRAGDHVALAECARARGDMVHFVAALLAQRAVPQARASG